MRSVAAFGTRRDTELKVRLVMTCVCETMEKVLIERLFSGRGTRACTACENAPHLGLLSSPNYRASEGAKEDAGMNAEIPRIRILTVDDHPVVRQGIAGLLGIQP